MARREQDFYPTPDETIEAFLDVYEVRGGISILEPGAGDGNIVRALRRHGLFDIDAIEIRPEERENLEEICSQVTIGDFLDVDIQKKYDLVIGNPPFSLALEFIQRAFQVVKPGGKVIFLLRTAFLESDRRFSFWQEPGHIPTGLYTLHKRPSFTGKGTDAQSYSWFVWDFSSDKQVIKVI